MSFFSKLTRTIGAKPRPSRSVAPKQKPSIADDGRELIFAAKEEAIRIRSLAEEEARKLRNELVELERRLAQKEEVLDNRLKTVEEREKSTEAIKAEIEKIKADQLARLQKIAGLSIEEAKEKILTAVEERSRGEAGKLVRAIIDEAKEEGNKKAREIIVTEMIHGATDLVAEYTVSTVAVPSE